MNRGLKNTERLKQGIGEVIISFQFIELELADLLSDCLQLKDEKDSQRILASMSFRQKTQLLCDIYPDRKNTQFPNVDISKVRSALSAAEGFRNSIVHSYWYVSGERHIIWMRKKPNISSKSGLKINDGVVDLGKLEKGITCLQTIRSWYLGDTEKLDEAAITIRSCTNQLSREVTYRSVG